MAHMMKYTKASCGHMFAHYDRRAEHISNENLDRTRTYLNYNLATHQTMEQGEFVRKRCAEVHCQNRKDVNVMVSWVVTAPKDLPENEQRAFFEASYDFLKNRYGLENVVSAYVHMDEVTPHMHFAFVPVKHGFKQDKKNPDISTEYWKVSAKEVVNRYDLQSFHESLQRFVEKRLGHKVSILNEATREGNKSIEELKRQSATERLQEAAVEAAQLISKAHIERDSVKSLEAEYRAKRAYIRACDAASEVSMMYPDYAIVKKGLFGKETVTVPKDKWEERHIAVSEKQCLEKATSSFEKAIDNLKIKKSALYVRVLEEQVDEYKQENRELKEKIITIENSEQLVLKKLKRVLAAMPKEFQEEFQQHWNSEKKHSRKRSDSYLR